MRLKECIHLFIHLLVMKEKTADLKYEQGELVAAKLLLWGDARPVLTTNVMLMVEIRIISMQMLSL